MTQLLCYTYLEEIAHNVNAQGDRTAFGLLATINSLCDAPLIFELVSGTLTSIPEMKLPSSNQNRRQARHRRRCRLVWHSVDVRDRSVNNPTHIQRLRRYYGTEQ